MMSDPSQGNIGLIKSLAERRLALSASVVVAQATELAESETRHPISQHSFPL